MEDAWVLGNAFLFGWTTMSGRAIAYGQCKVGGRSIITCNARVTGNDTLINFVISGDQCYGLMKGKRT
jgi:hypothetical protein